MGHAILWRLVFSGSPLRHAKWSLSVTPNDPEAIAHAEALLFPNQPSDRYSRAAAKLYAFEILSMQTPTLHVGTLRFVVDALRAEDSKP